MILEPGQYYEIKPRPIQRKGPRRSVEYVYVKSTNRLGLFLKVKSDTLECFKLHELACGIVCIKKSPQGCNL